MKKPASGSPAPASADKAVFLDRDGTIIEDRGYISSADDILLYPWAAEALRKLQDHYALFVITNQSGIAKGLISQQEAEYINGELDRMLKEQGVSIREWYTCPHDTGDGCACRKPKPYFLLKARQDYGIDLKQSFIIGDHPHDPAAGDSVGTFGLYVLTGHGMKHIRELPENRIVFHSLADAADWMLEHPEPGTDLQKLIDAGAQVIRNGGLTAFPTETVYGLGADALNPEAVRKIFTAKQRPFFDPLIVHIADTEQLRELTAPLTEKMKEPVKKLTAAFWPGPLTLVLPKNSRVPDIVTAGKSTVAVRMPSNPWARALIREAGTPIAAPSANLFGRTSPTTARHVREQLEEACDVIIDAGACRVGVESAVLSLAAAEETGCPVLLRAGGISQEEIEAVIGPVRTASEQNPESQSAKISQTPHTPQQPRKQLHRETEQRIDVSSSPGLLENHYAPVTPLRIVEDTALYADQQDVGVILFEKPKQPYAGPVEIVSRNGDLHEIAAHLYAAVRRLDLMGLRMMAVGRVKDEGIGRAVNDRLKKASRKQR